jgi:hypothetical protein
VWRRNKGSKVVTGGISDFQVISSSRATKVDRNVRRKTVAAVMSIFYQIVDLLGNTTDERCSKRGRDSLS